MEPQHQFALASRKFGKVAWRIAAQGKRLLLPPRDYVTFKGSRLPPRGLRFNGPDHADDAFLLTSASQEAERVTGKLRYDPSDLLVDLGCGQGRLAIGLVRVLPRARYLGLDVSARSIEWCAKHIGRQYPSYEFKHIDLVNARYNPFGSPLPSHFRLPAGDASAALVYLWGVVTNMEPEHLRVYANEIARMLRPGGQAFLTANIEDNVPEVAVNPEKYVSFEYDGPLHIVRYEQRYFVDVFERAGLRLERLDYHASSNCQSELYFVKR
jgi:SAM-dependent methyltransferase